MPHSKPKLFTADDEAERDSTRAGPAVCSVNVDWGPVDLLSQSMLVLLWDCKSSIEM